MSDYSENFSGFNSCNVIKIPRVRNLILVPSASLGGTTPCLAQNETVCCFLPRNRANFDTLPLKWSWITPIKLVMRLVYTNYFSNIKKILLRIYKIDINNKTCRISWVGDKDNIISFSKGVPSWGGATTMSYRIREERTRLGLTQAELGIAISPKKPISQQTIQCWEDPKRGVKPRRKHMAALATALHVTPIHLEYGYDEKQTPWIQVLELTSNVLQESLEGHYDENSKNLIISLIDKVSDKLDKFPTDLRANHCPEIEWDTLSKLDGEVGLVDLDKVANWYACPTKCGLKTYVMQNMGKSMWPDYQDMERLFIDPDLPPRNNYDVIVLIDGFAVLKRLYTEGMDRYIESINPNWPGGGKVVRLRPEDKTCGVVICSLKISDL